MTEWIKVSERLPESCQYVLVHEKYEEVPMVAYLMDGLWQASFHYVECKGDCKLLTNVQRQFVTHWMPLPQLPKD